MELFAAVSVREHLVHRGGETPRVAHCLGTGRERPVVELAVGNETRELEQAAPYVASGAHEVKQRVLREHRPPLALPALEYLVENRSGHRYDDDARNDAREQRVSQPERVVGEIPHDRTGKDEHTDESDDAGRT